jgi:hypothetical protein
VDNGVNEKNGDQYHQSTPWHQYFDFGDQVISGARDTEDLNFLKAKHKELKDNLVRKCAKKHNPHEPDTDWERIKNEIDTMEAQFQMHVKTLEDKKEKEKEEEVNKMFADSPCGDPGETLGHEPARSPPLRVLQQSGSGAGGGAGGKRAADAAPDTAHEEPFHNCRVIFTGPSASRSGGATAGDTPCTLTAADAASSAGQKAVAPAKEAPQGTGGVSAFSAEKEAVSPDKMVVVRFKGNYTEVPEVNKALEAVRSYLLDVLDIKEEIIQGTPSGLEWLKIGDVPSDGDEILDNPQLRDALSLKRGTTATFTRSEWDAFGVQKLHIGHFVKIDDSCYFKPVARQGLPHDMALMVYVSVGPQPSNVLEGVWEQELKTFISKQCMARLEAFGRKSECSKWEDDKIGISVSFNADQPHVGIVLDQKDGGEEREMMSFVSCMMSFVKKQVELTWKESPLARPGELKECKRLWGTNVTVETSIDTLSPTIERSWLSKEFANKLLVSVPERKKFGEQIPELTHADLEGCLKAHLNKSDLQHIAAQISGTKYFYFPGSIIVVTSGMCAAAANLLQYAIVHRFRDEKITTLQMIELPKHWGMEVASAGCYVMKESELPRDIADSIASVLHAPGAACSVQAPETRTLSAGGSKGQRGLQDVVNTQPLAGENPLRTKLSHGNPQLGLEYDGESLGETMHGYGTLTNLLGKYGAKGDYVVGTNGFWWHKCQGTFDKDKMTGPGGGNQSLCALRVCGRLPWKWSCLFCLQMIKYLSPLLEALVCRQDCMAEWRRIRRSNGSQPAVRGHFDEGGWLLVQRHICPAVSRSHVQLQAKAQEHQATTWREHQVRGPNGS